MYHRHVDRRAEGAHAGQRHVRAERRRRGEDRAKCAAAAVQATKAERVRAALHVGEWTIKRWSAKCYYLQILA